MSEDDDRTHVLLDGNSEEDENYDNPQQQQQQQKLRRRDEGRLQDSSGYYAALGVSEKATPQDIRRAFLHLSQRYHTDKHMNQSNTAQELMNDRFQELQDAYSVLSDEKQRAAYDAAGSRGIERLALVPKSIVTSQGIIDYITSLDREAQIVRTAKMLSASTDIVMTYSIAHLLLPSHMLSGGAGHLVHHDGGEDGGGEAEDAHANDKSGANAGKLNQSAATLADATEGKREPTSGAASPQGEDVWGEATDTQLAASTGEQALGQQAIFTQMEGRVVTIDGKQQIVLIPSGELEKQLWARLRAAGVVAGGSGTEGGGSNAATPLSTRRRRISPARMVMMAVVPKSLQFRHSFQHAINRRMGVVFRTDGRCAGPNADVSVTTEFEYQKDAVNTYAVTLRTATRGLKLAVVKQRVLNPLWTLRSKLTCVNGFRLFQKLEFTLSRHLSSLTELESTIAWSLTENGFFKTSITRSLSAGQQVLSTYISYHGMTIAAYTSTAVTYGVDTLDGSDSAQKQAKGRVQYSINCSPFSGQTHLGFEAWYFHSRLQHYGLSFMTVIPYSISPIAPPFFGVGSAQRAVVNQISVLYARGQHRISVPIIVFISPQISRAVMWLSLPICVYRVGCLLYKPVAQARASRYYTALRREHVAEVDIAREKAMLEQTALYEGVSKSQALEARRGGLVIANARYGVLAPRFVEDEAEERRRIEAASERKGLISRVAEVLGLLFSFGKRGMKSGPSSPVTTAFAPGFTTTASSAVDNGAEGDDDGGDILPLTIDVTVAVQNLVRSSSLVLPCGTKSKLVGFCDPDPYTPEKKQLKIVYWFNKKKHVVVVGDEDHVELPQREHMIAS